MKLVIPICGKTHCELQTQSLLTQQGLGGRFVFFSARGREGEGGVRGAEGGGICFLLKIPEGGLQNGGGPGAVRVSAANWGNWVGQIFFRGLLKPGPSWFFLGPQASRSGLVRPDVSFLVLFGTFPIFFRD